MRPMRERINTFNLYLRRRYGCRVQRVPVNLGLGCPHREGRTGRGGCIYCDETGSGVLPADIPVEEQVKRGIAFAERRYGARLFMVYFQAFCNTYAEPERLDELYRRALFDERVVGVIVGTRPDLLPGQVVEVLKGLSERYEVWVELGLQSSHFRTLRLINRGHGVSHFVDATLRLKAAGIKVCAHVILGLPGEDTEDMMETALFLSALPVDGVKIHCLHVLKGTPLEEMYRRGEVRLFEMEEYVDVCVSFLERLRADVVVQRLTGEAPPEKLVAPLWCLEKARVINAIKMRLEEVDTHQGRKCPFSQPPFCANLSPA